VADPLGAGIVWFRDLTGASQVVAVPDDTIESATAVAFPPLAAACWWPVRQDSRWPRWTSPTGRGRPSRAPARGGPGAVGNLFRLNEFGWRPVVATGHSARPGADCLRASRAFRFPRTPSPAPPGDSRADRIALASVDRGQQGPARTSPTCRSSVECVQSRRLVGLVVAPRGTQGISSDLAIRRLAARSPREKTCPNITSQSCATRERRLDPDGCPESR
jgi:hypothetical protein